VKKCMSIRGTTTIYKKARARFPGRGQSTTRFAT
jgi:hypothetical protein